MDRYLITSFTRAFKLSGSVFLIILAIHGAIATTKVGEELKLIPLTWFVYGYAILLTYIFLALLSTSLFYTYSVKGKENYNNKGLYDILSEDMHNAFNTKRWAEVLKIGSVISRPLWVLGKYKLREEIGKYVETAASHLGKYDIQAKTLIDDLGWTKYETGDTGEAVKNIKVGLELAQENNYYEIAYKALRHLSGIEIFESRSKDQAEAYLNEAAKLVKFIENPTLKQEAHAGIMTNRGLLFLVFDKDGDSALKAFEAAKNIYIGLEDRDREVKLLPFIADSYISKNLHQKAKNVYREGVAKAQAEGRLDTEIKCELGLGKIIFDSKDRSESLRHFEKVISLAKELGNQKVISEAEYYIQHI